jgi:hypothetical protein
MQLITMIIIKLLSGEILQIPVTDTTNSNISLVLFVYILKSIRSPTN